MLSEIKDIISRHGTEHPWVIFAAIVILPGLGFPSSVLFLMAGAIWGADFKSGSVALAAVLFTDRRPPFHRGAALLDLSFPG